MSDDFYKDKTYELILKEIRDSRADFREAIKDVKDDVDKVKDNVASINRNIHYVYGAVAGVTVFFNLIWLAVKEKFLFFK